MNTHHDSSPEPNDDRLLEKMLFPLKRLEPPLEARIANRQAVAAALSSPSAVNQQRHLPWWHRSVSIPVPFAAALVLLMAATFCASFRNWQQPSAPLVAAPGQAAKNTATAGGNRVVLGQPVPNAYLTSKNYETETYLCGVGRVSSESYYVIKGQNP